MSDTRIVYLSINRATRQYVLKIFNYLGKKMNPDKKYLSERTRVLIPGLLAVFAILVPPSAGFINRECEGRPVCSIVKLLTAACNCLHSTVP